MDIVKILRLLNVLNAEHNTHTHFQLFSDHSGAFLYHKWNTTTKRFEEIQIDSFGSFKELSQILENHGVV